MRALFSLMSILQDGSDGAAAIYAATHRHDVPMTRRHFILLIAGVTC
jgi:hypothetical protein